MGNFRPQRSFTKKEIHALSLQDLCIQDLFRCLNRDPEDLASRRVFPYIMHALLGMQIVSHMFPIPSQRQRRMEIKRFISLAEQMEASLRKRALQVGLKSIDLTQDATLKSLLRPQIEKVVMESSFKGHPPRLCKAQILNEIFSIFETLLNVYLQNLVKLQLKMENSPETFNASVGRPKEEVKRLFISSFCNIFDLFHKWGKEDREKQVARRTLFLRSAFKIFAADGGNKFISMPASDQELKRILPKPLIRHSYIRDEDLFRSLNAHTCMFMDRSNPLPKIFLRESEKEVESSQGVSNWVPCAEAPYLMRMLIGRG